MSVTFAVTVKRPITKKDRWGDGPATADHTVAGCWIYTESSTELQAGRGTGNDGHDTITSKTVLIAPYGADITAVDELVAPASEPVPPQYRGARFKVDGEPFPWRSPLTGWAPGVQVNLVEVRG